MSKWSEIAEQDKGHKLRRTPDGEVDEWVLDYEHHNGPGCDVCDEMWCQHCFSANNIPPCDGGAAKRDREARHDRRVDLERQIVEFLRANGQDALADEWTAKP